MGFAVQQKRRRSSNGVGVGFIPLDKLGAGIVLSDRESLSHACARGFGAAGKGKG
jgi:hypothetical protein